MVKEVGSPQRRRRKTRRQRLNNRMNEEEDEEHDLLLIASSARISRAFVLSIEGGRYSTTSSQNEYHSNVRNDASRMRSMTIAKEAFLWRYWGNHFPAKMHA